MKPSVTIVSCLTGFIIGLVSAHSCSTRAAEPQPIYDPVHLKKGDKAPFDGDLVDPDDLIELLNDAECDVEKLATQFCEQKNTVLVSKHREELKAVEDARLACERRPPLIVEQVKPVPFYERPWFTLTVGVILGGAAATLVVMGAN